MNRYDTFIFNSYEFNVEAKQLTLTYGLNDSTQFTETYNFNFPFVEYNPAELDRALQNLFFMAGVSYYKTYLPPHIEIRTGELDAASADFFSKSYQRGLGEFFYVNKLNPRTSVVFPSNVPSITASLSQVSDGSLVGLGGGKDSLVSVEMLQNQPNTVTWSLGHADQLQPLIKRTGMPHLSVERTWDRSLLTHNANGAYNGHVPISAIFACVGTLVGILSGHKDSVVSNENSANEPTLTYDDVSINHQYSKSLEFEQDYQRLLEGHFTNGSRYFSLLRPLSELRIAELFARTGFEKYQDVFSSCNRAFVHTSHTMSWCGECPKCAFVFLALTPFVERKSLEKLWGGKNLLLDTALEKMYYNLLGIAGEKPLECVGEVKESRAAMRLAQQYYPELSKYTFDLPENYDYRALAPHSMPSEYYDILTGFIQ